MIDGENLTEEELEEIAEGFESLKQCDETCLSIFIHNKWALHKTVEWAKSEKLLLKRAAFMIMVGLAREDKEAKNFVFRVFLPILIRESRDTREEIQEAILLALVAIAKRNSALKKGAIESAKQLPKAVYETFLEHLEKNTI